MISLIPKRVEITSSLSRKDFLKKLCDGICLTEETGLFKVNKFLKVNWENDVFYGSTRENAFTVFHHSKRKHDGGGVRFNGVVVDTADGCKTVGYIRHGIFTYLFSLVWTVILLMASVVFLVKDPPQAAASLILLTAGNFLVLCDRKNAKALEEFAKGLSEKNESEN